MAEKEHVSGHQRKDDYKMYGVSANRIRISDIPMIRNQENLGYFLSDSFDENKSPLWANTAQKYINHEKGFGRRAFVIHVGNMHYLFMEKMG